MDTLEEFARRLDAFENVDKSDFQRKARILQALWRIEKGYESCGSGGKVYGARIPMPWAKETLANYLDDAIRQVVRDEVLDPRTSKGKMYAAPRIFNNLLSSQPMAFNLCAYLSRDHQLATKVFSHLTNDNVLQVTEIKFEHSPGRGDKTYTGDHSAFDVYIEYKNSHNETGFIGIEVKYHEDLKNPPSEHHQRYDEVAAASGCFQPQKLHLLKKKPLQQIWRDHLLALSLLQNSHFDEGFFVYLSPRDNHFCNEAVASYRDCLTCQKTFVDWTLEQVVEAIKSFTSDRWIDVFYDRYLNFDKIAPS